MQNTQNRMPNTRIRCVRKRSRTRSRRRYRNLANGTAAFLTAAAVGISTLGAGALLSVDAAGKRQADTDTRYNYLETLGADNSTRYAGRIWTDKTVSSDDITFTGDIAENAVAIKREDAEFLVTYSALATSESIVSEQPVDVVFILDLSASMCWGTDASVVSDPSGSDSRISAMVDALNSAIEGLTESNENNRIAISVFHGSSSTLLELTEASAINKTIVDGEYLTMTSFTGTQGADDGKAQVTCNINGISASTDGGTNIQAGLDEGMSILADESDTLFQTSKGAVGRIPNVVLMSDGAPTTFASADDAQWTDHDDGDRTKTERITRDSNIQDERTRSGSWWNGVADEAIGGGDNDTPHSANGFMALLTASYLKNEITENYYKNDPEGETNVYTIGFSTDQQTAGMVEMANLVLDPGANLEKAAASSTDAVQETAEAWQAYRSQSSPVVRGKLGQSGTERSYYVDMPLNDELNPDSIIYPTESFTAESAESLNHVFDEIVSDIISSAEVPTELSGSGDALHDGYITYQDPIGDYMEVQDVKAILYGGHLINVKDVEVSGNTVTYRFHGQINSPVYGVLDASLIEIQVQSSQDAETGKVLQELFVRIPAAAIPMRINTVTLHPDGSVISNTDNNAYPVRVIYSVGLQQDVIDQKGNADAEKIAEDYLEANRTNDGRIRFYQGRYSGNTDDGYADTQKDGKTVGDATAAFVPARTNPYYYVQDNIPLFTNEFCTSPAMGTIDPEQTYYYEITYYEGTSEKNIVASREGNTFLEANGSSTAAPTGSGGQLELQAGAPKLGNLSDFIKEKTDITLTQTAEAAYYPTYQGNGEFRVYLGNNGIITTEVREKQEDDPGSAEETPDDEIPGEETPGAEMPEDELPEEEKPVEEHPDNEITDEEVKEISNQNQNIQTGDAMQVLPILGMLTTAVAAAGTMIYLIRKKQ